MGRRKAAQRRLAFVAAGFLVAVAAWGRPDIAASLLLLGIVFTIVEWWRPLRQQPAAVRRSGAATDAAGFVVNEVLGAVGLGVVLFVTVPVVRALVPAQLPALLEAQAGWLRWLEAFVVSEVGGYWGHRLSHEIPDLWRFHRVHHSAEHMDWLAPNRRHPVDLVVARTSTALPALVLGFSVPTVVTYFALKRLQGLFVHANVNLRFGRLEWLVATPFFHHWHHADGPDSWNKNYAGSLPLVDWVFGSLHLPEGWPPRYGCDGHVPDRGYLARFASAWAQPDPARPVAEGTPHRPPVGTWRPAPPTGRRGVEPVAGR